jgi:hypothetical protein
MEKGNIYKIVSDSIDKIYIGSTVKSLEKRLEEHENSYEIWYHKDFRRGYCTSFEILKYGDYKIILIEEFPSSSIEELHKREGYYQMCNFFNCVNTNIAGGRDKSVEINNDELYTCSCAKDIQINLKTRYKHIKSQKHKKKIKETHLEMIKINPKFVNFMCLDVS